MGRIHVIAILSVSVLLGACELLLWRFEHPPGAEPRSVAFEMVVGGPTTSVRIGVVDFARPDDVEVVGSESSQYYDPRFAPDGRRITFADLRSGYVGSPGFRLHDRSTGDTGFITSPESSLGYVVGYAHSIIWDEGGTSFIYGTTMSDVAAIIRTFRFLFDFKTLTQLEGDFIPIDRVGPDSILVQRLLSEGRDAFDLYTPSDGSLEPIPNPLLGDSLDRFHPVGWNERLRLFVAKSLRPGVRTPQDLIVTDWTGAMTRTLVDGVSHDEILDPRWCGDEIIVSKKGDLVLIDPSTGESRVFLKASSVPAVREIRAADCSF